MPSSTIMLIRHAEKPDPQWGSGVDSEGNPDPDSLAPRGWQRAGAWTELFAPSLLAQGGLPRPDRIFASVPRDPASGKRGGVGSKSRRPAETVDALACKLSLSGVDETYAKGQEELLAGAITALSGVTLVCWQHECIAAITRHIPTANAASVPQGWPDDRYNPVLRFRREDGQAVWTFDQVVPFMLGEDSPTPI